MASDPAPFAEIISDKPAPIQEIAWAARDLIFEALPNTTEVVWIKQRNAGYGTGPKKMSEQFSWISSHSAHVSLGFYYGTELPDPDGLLEGTGAKLRHVKLRSLADARRPSVRALLEIAVTHRVPKPTNEDAITIRA